MISPRYRKPEDPNGAPDDVMVGLCHACKADVVAVRRLCNVRGGFTLAGCPQCGAAVSVIKRPAVVEKGFQDQ